ncbi:hypothetical protein PN498_20895 [Oscillatoria sp. CS-180]|uniref:hypothetical protein n=1 Tax=Oscillatoria sp. CS-180 TaxID=3021720 RepID=UPI0023306BDC|nr:hypothetical protein [Oscillatoria sp. CS-180]MDB9528462.1 hypothetical protein [Oscillatoria sp. CS-180]
MVSAAQEPYGIQALVQKAVRAKQLSRQEHLKLTTAMLSDPKMASADRFHINRLLDYVRAGKIRLTDE